MNRLPAVAVAVLMSVSVAHAADTPAAKPKGRGAKPVKAAAAESVLDARERAQQMLNRFSFGARPGDVEKLVADGPDGARKWFEQQLDPKNIKDGECDRRLRDYPTLFMGAAQIQQTYPDRGTIGRVVDGKIPYPGDSQLAAVYEVQTRKMEIERDNKQNVKQFQMADEEKAKLRETAMRIGSELYAMPKKERMDALLKMSVDDRIAFARYVPDQIKYPLLNDWTPKERGFFYVMSSGSPDASYRALDELAQGAIMRDILTERQLQAVMTDFWFNHFNVYGPKDQDRWYMAPYVRDAIMRNALGKFPDLLMATATHPAMMVYLDNWLSIGPDSPQNNPANGKKGAKGLNENYAREVMELHTLSVNGGYSQADVTQLAAVLTGWTVDHPELAGPFVFDAKKHQPGDKQWMGQTIKAGEADEALGALKQLAMSPKTAHFIAWKLAQRFLADDPPASVVDKMAATYTSTGGDIKAILRTLVDSQEFNSHRYFRNKVKTPVEFVASVFRSTATDPTNPGAIVNTIANMGEPMFRKIEPTGYYITADKWMNTSALLDRLNFALSLTSNRVGGQRFDSAKLLALGLMSQPAGTSPQMLASNSVLPEMSAHAVRASQQMAAKREARSDEMDGMPAAQAEPATRASGADAHATGTGAELALSVLETSLVGGRVSAQTNRLIMQQTGKSAEDGGPANAPAKLDMLAALVIGSPEFQQR